MIPRTRNHSGFPGGISGRDLLARMEEQAAEFGVVVEQTTVEAIDRVDGAFRAVAQGREWIAQTVLVATGVINNRPPILPEVHDRALQQGLLRYCPICDGYEVTDRDVGVIGTGDHGRGEALFLRAYTANITLIAPDGPHDLDAEARRELEDVGVRLIDGPCHALRIDGGKIFASTPVAELGFHTIYPALGSKICSDLARSLGAEASEDGCLVIDRHQRTSIEGLYAAGDVTKGLDQISHAMGEAAVAATAIRNDLRARRPLLRRRAAPLTTD